MKDLASHQLTVAGDTTILYSLLAHGLFLLAVLLKGKSVTETIYSETGVDGDMEESVWSVN